jgi:hypothetical protein
MIATSLVVECIYYCTQEGKVNCILTNFRALDASSSGSPVPRSLSFQEREGLIQAPPRRERQAVREKVGIGSWRRVMLLF